jgi:hypothetical protein
MALKMRLIDRLRYELSKMELCEEIKFYDIDDDCTYIANLSTGEYQMLKNVYDLTTSYVMSWDVPERIKCKVEILRLIFEERKMYERTQGDTD